MNNKNCEIIKQFWHSFNKRDYRGTEKFLDPECEVHLVCTDERFSKDEFIQLNEDYPGRWRTVLRNLFSSNEQVITFTHVFSPDSVEQFYVSSIFSFENCKIIQIEEYWSTVEKPPEWRRKD